MAKLIVVLIKHLKMTPIKQYIEENKQRFLDELFGLIRIPSISSIADHKPDMLKAAEYWKETILKAGADKAVVMPSDGNPVVYGEKLLTRLYPLFWFMPIMT